MTCNNCRVNRASTVIHQVNFSSPARWFHHTNIALLSATSTVHNRSIAPKPLVNTSFLSPSHTTVSVQPNVSIVQSSFLNGGVSKADIPYRSLAQFGVLSKYSIDLLPFEPLFLSLFRLHTQIFDYSDPNSFIGSLAPLQGLPGAAHLDMNVSCLFMHEVNRTFDVVDRYWRLFFSFQLRHKYRHGEYQDLEEISEDHNDEPQCWGMTIFLSPVW